MSYRRPSQKQYALKHKIRTRALTYLREKGPVPSFSELAKGLKINGKHRRTFYRVCEEERAAGTMVVRGDGVYAYGHEPPEKVELYVSPGNVTAKVEVPREEAKKVIKETPLAKDETAKKVLNKAKVLE